MQIKILIILLLISTSIFGQTEIPDYEVFLNKQQTPKEYIFELWEEADIIVLGERDHRDTTQYNLILDILSDKRFIENVGHLYLEVGVINATEKANDLISRNYENDNFSKKFVEFQMLEVWHPMIWENYNRYQLFSGLNEINKNQAEDKKIRLGLIDMEFSWDDMNVEEYRKFKFDYMNRSYTAREKIMADNFLSFYSAQQPRSGNKKALIITSREYAGKFNVRSNGMEIKRKAGYIKDIYGEKVKTVAINWYKWIPLSYERENTFNLLTNGLSAGGKWDAAFELTNCNPVGFNLQDSPFGKDEYDYPFDNQLKWEDVFDGYIFYEPYYNFIAKIGFPCQLTSKQAKEIVHRLIIYDKTYGNKKNVRLLKWFGWVHKHQLKKDYSQQKEFPCVKYLYDAEKMKEEMNQWLEK